MKFELKETVVDVVGTNWRSEVAVMTGKIWVYERALEIVQLRHICSDIFGRYGELDGGSAHYFFWN